MWKIGDILRANPGFEDEVGEGYTRFSLQRTPGGSFVTEIESSVLQDCLFKVQMVQHDLIRTEIISGKYKGYYLEQLLWHRFRRVNRVKRTGRIW